VFGGAAATTAAGATAAGSQANSSSLFGFKSSLSGVKPAGCSALAHSPLASHNTFAAAGQPFGSSSSKPAFTFALTDQAPDSTAMSSKTSAPTAAARATEAAAACQLDTVLAVKLHWGPAGPPSGGGAAGTPCVQLASSCWVRPCIWLCGNSTVWLSNWCDFTADACVRGFPQHLHSPALALQTPLFCRDSFNTGSWCCCLSSSLWSNSRLNSCACYGSLYSVVWGGRQYSTSLGEACCDSPTLPQTSSVPAFRKS